MRYSLSTGKESAGLRHPVAMLTLRTDAPGHSGDSENGCAHDSSVDFPVGRLGIPASGGRPDFFGVTAAVSVSSQVAN